MPKTPPLRLTIYRARDGWRWHAKRSGRIVAESGEAYKQRASLLRTLNRLIECLRHAQFVIEGVK